MNLLELLVLKQFESVIRHHLLFLPLLGLTKIWVSCNIFDNALNEKESMIIKLIWRFQIREISMILLLKESVVASNFRFLYFIACAFMCDGCTENRNQSENKFCAKSFEIQIIYFSKIRENRHWFFALFNWISEVKSWETKQWIQEKMNFFLFETHVDIFPGQGKFEMKRFISQRNCQFLNLDLIKSTFLRRYLLCPTQMEPRDKRVRLENFYSADI